MKLIIRKLRKNKMEEKKETIMFTYNNKNYKFVKTMHFPSDHLEQIDFINDCYKWAGVKNRKKVTNKIMTVEGWNFFCGFVA